MSTNIHVIKNRKENKLSRKRRKSNSKYQEQISPYQGNTVEFQKYAPRQRNIRLHPKSLRQETYIDLLTDPEKMIVFATGPAGTGKTMLAVLAGLRAYREGEVNKIILTRPAVGVDDEQHGFLPGNINQKMEPWTRPLFDVMHEYYSPKETAKMLDEGIIEISPLAFMRGRTFKDAWIIADEMQNATPGQMKMLLTRLGQGSKMVVTGDTRQADRKEADNGLLNFESLCNSYEELNYVGGVKMLGKDIHRHPAVVEVLQIYSEI
jgi:phosphate starvation-inducible PhoH-like protein